MRKNVQHLGVYALIYKEDQLLVIKKARGPYMGKYDMPGGSFEHGESSFECLDREMQEEIGVGVQCAELLHTFTATVDFEDERGELSMHHVGIIYNNVTLKNGVIDESISFEDVDGSEYIPLSEFNEDNASPLLLKAINFNKQNN